MGDIRISYFQWYAGFLPGSVEPFRVHHWKWWLNIRVIAAVGQALAHAIF